MRNTTLLAAASLCVSLMLVGEVHAIWQPNGNGVCTAASIQRSPAIIPDGTGGAIIAWEDYRTSGDIYAQRMSATGVPLWTANGVLIRTDPDSLTSSFGPNLVSDGAGGAIITWLDRRSGQNQVYGQRVNASGVPQWTTNGVAIGASEHEHVNAAIVSDGGGGAIVTWAENRTGQDDIYVQRVSFQGVVQWTPDGVALCTAVNWQSGPRIVSDDAGGAIVTWSDPRSATDFDIYAQRVSAGGIPLWTADGEPVCTFSDDQVHPAIALVGLAAGAIIAWQDGRNPTLDIFAQRVDLNGLPLWGVNGVGVSVVGGHQVEPRIVTDGSNGAIVAWIDGRGADPDIFAQRLAQSGGGLWTVNGVAVATPAGDQKNHAITSDGFGSAIVAWGDRRSGNNDDIYAQRIEFNYGYWGFPEPILNSVLDMPADQGMMVELEWTASQHDVVGGTLIDHYSIWRSIDVPGSTWEMVGVLPATGLPEYEFDAPTTFNSGPGGIFHRFQIFAHTSSSEQEWPSNILDGYSVDNLAPGSPYALAAVRQPDGVHLIWDHDPVPDLDDYAIYRSLTPGKNPGPSQFLMSSTGTTAIDTDAPMGALYYCVTARDVNNNESAPSNEASVSTATGVSSTPLLTRLTVLQNQPNPFTATTDFEVGLPVASDVKIDVFDVAGRRVSEVNVAGVKGWQRIPFVGRDQHGDPLASGVYFYRVNAAGATMTKKMVIAR